MSTGFTVQSDDDIRSDFEMITSDQPDVIQRALAAEGQVEDGKDGVDGKSAEGDDKSAAPETGADSDSAVGDQVDDEGNGDAPKPEDDDKIVEADIEGEKLKVSHGINKRFGKLTAKVSDRDRQIADLNRQLAEAKAATATAKPAEKPAAAAAETAAAELIVEKFVAAPEPKDTDTNPDGTPKYPTYGDFIKGHAKWSRESVEQATEHMTKQAAKLVETAVKKLELDLATKSAMDRANEEVAKIQKAFEDRQTKFATAKDAKGNPLRPDFNELVKKNKNNVGASLPVKRIIFQHEKGPDLQYYLCSHPDEAAKLAALPEDQQAFEAGVLIARLDTPKTPKPKTVLEGSDTGKKTGVKPPPAPLPRGGASGNRGTVTRISNQRAGTMDFDDYAAARANGSIR